MVAPAAGAVVLVRFPFSDLSRTKVRPAVVLADVGRGGLRITSHARPGKLFTANSDLIDSEAAVLTPEALTRIIDAVVRILRSAEPR